MINLIANIVGSAAAIVFVGYFAYTVDKLPLIIIVTLCLALMLCSFYDDMRNDHTFERLHSGNRSR